MQAIFKQIPLITLSCSVLSTATLAIINPKGALLETAAKHGSYLDLFSQDYIYFVLFYTCIATLILVYLFLSKQRIEFSNRTLIITTILLTTFAALTFPIIWDPIYYHLAGSLWVKGLANPFVELVSYVQNHPPEFIQIPVFHNYAYGPLWLLLSGFATRITNSYYLFSLILTGFGCLALWRVIFIVQKVIPSLTKSQVFIHIFLNPLALIFLLPAGNNDIFTTLAILFAIFYTTRKKHFFSALFAILACSIKYSALPIAILIMAYSFGQTKEKLRFTTFCVLTILTVTVVTGLLFGFHVNYLDGLIGFINYERAHSISLGYLLSLAIPQVKIINLQITGHTIATFITGVILGLVFIRQLLATITRGLQQPTVFYRAATIMSLATIYLTDVSPKGWYLTLPLCLSLLAGDEWRNTTRTITILLTVSILCMSISSPSGSVSALASNIESVLLTIIIPLLLIIKTSHSSKSNQLAGIPVS